MAIKTRQGRVISVDLCSLQELIAVTSQHIVKTQTHAEEVQLQKRAFTGQEPLRLLVLSTLCSYPFPLTVSNLIELLSGLCHSYKSRITFRGSIAYTLAALASEKLAQSVPRAKSPRALRASHPGWLATDEGHRYIALYNRNVPPIVASPPPATDLHPHVPPIERHNGGFSAPKAVTRKIMIGGSLCELVS